MAETCWIVKKTAYAYVRKTFPRLLGIFINMVFEIAATSTLLRPPRTLALGFARCIGF